MTSNSTDYDALAKRYLDLWQAEMAKLAQDPNAAGAWANLFQGMMQNAAALTAGLNNGFTSSFNATRSGPGSTPWPAAAAATPGDGGVALADVLRRIESLERRLAALEAHPPALRRTRQPKP